MLIKKVLRKLNFLIKLRKTRIEFRKCNENVFLPKDLELRNPQYIHLKKDAVLGVNCKLLCTTEFLGQNFSPNLTIGKNFHATRNLVIQCCQKVSIGDDCLFASNVFIIDFNHGTDPLTLSYLDNPLCIRGGVYIEDGCWLGNSVIVLSGVTIGKKSIIGAGSVVTSDIPEYSMAAGNPAKVIKKYNFNTNKWEGLK